MTIERRLEPRRPGDPDRLVADNSRILATLPWRPKRDRLDDIVAETLGATTSERQGRIIDKDGAGSMERKKQEGYF